jgi:uncharacterized repeat protein (TIGR03806 family)
MLLWLRQRSNPIDPMNFRFPLRLLACLGLLSGGAASAQNLAINAGGPAVGGFSADAGFFNGFSYGNPAATISGAVEAPAAVYKTERWGNFFYTFTGLAAGAPFEVRLHFAEIYWTAVGKRVFDVTINGETALSGYDIFAKAGANTAIVEKIATVADDDGKVTVEFATVLDNAKVSAIELRPLFTGSPVARAAIQPGKGGDGAVTPFLNGKLPFLNPSQLSGSEGWAAVPAFPNLAGNFNELMDIDYVPRTNPVQMVLRQRGGMVSVCPEKPDVTMGEVKVFLNLTGVVSTQGNGGISSLAFHPDFNLAGSPNKDFVYAWYQTIQGGVMYNRLSRFTRNPATGVVDNASELIMIQQKDLAPFDHTGGGMCFDKDGFLVLAIGDLEWTDEEYAEALTLDTLFQCSVIRIDVNMDPVKGFPATRTLQGGLVNGVATEKSLSGGRYDGGNSFSGIGYYIPKTNPYNDEDKDGAFDADDNAAPYNKVLKEHYAKGVRNPWNITKDPLTEALFMFDAGSNEDPKYEEINLLEAGKDYGWPYWEGPVAKTYETGIQPPAGAFLGGTDYWHYNHLNGNGNAIADGEFYRGTSLAELQGKMIFADFTSGKIWSLDPSGPAKTSAVLFDGDGGVSGIDSSSDGESIYIVYYNGGEILKLQSVGLPNPQPPARLSDTGAFTNLANLTPAPGMIPVAPASPLWSDNASKQRWIVIPNDGVRNTEAEKIGFSENDNWTFPVGSVFVKHFELAASASNPGSVYRLETRFMVHGEDGYFAFTYRWNDDGTEAYLLNDGSSASFKVVNAVGTTVNQVWDFPGRAACMDCHQAAAGRVLGVKTRSLNWTYNYADSPAQNQLLHLSAKGLFQASLTSGAVAGFMAAKGLGDTSATVEDRVRSYMDMNCSHCHMPGGVAGRATFDARMTTPLALAQLVNATPLADDVGLVNAKLIKPGDPANSVFAFRDGSRNPLIQMPPLGTRAVDSKYLALLTSWINTMGGGSPGDADGDGIPDGADLFPNDPLEWADANGDGVGDNTVLGPKFNVLAVNAGGPAVGTLAADGFFSGGSVATNAALVSGAPAGIPAKVFQSERQGNFSYTFSGLTSASYHSVDLHFAETAWTEAGKRKFDVAVNGKPVLDDVDLFVVAAGANKAWTKTVTVKPDAAGKILIQFTGVTGTAKVNAITLSKHLSVTVADTDGDGVPDAADVFPADPSEWADTNRDGVGDNVRLGAVRLIRAVNVGGGAAGSYIQDSNFTGGTAGSLRRLDIKGIPGAVPSDVFRTSRSGSFSYVFSGLMPSAFHRVDLHLAETSMTKTGARRFDVFTNDVLRLNDFDIFASAGGQKKAISRSLIFKSDATGKATIRFVSVVGGANLRGLALYQQSAVTVADSDGDGVPNEQDLFPADPKDWKDTDGDGYGDNADLFPNDPLDWKDSNGDGAGDNVTLGGVLPIRLTNAGGGATGAFKGDSGFSGGSVKSVKSFAVRGLPGVSVNIHRTSRTGNFSYTLTGLVPFGYHKAELYLSEDTGTRPGSRRFDVWVNNVLRLNDLDVFAAAGGRNKAVLRGVIFRADASGRATLRFVSVKGEAKLDGIGIFRQIAITAFDSDGDGVNNGADVFPANPAEWADADGDGYGDNGDAFPANPAEWADADGNGVGDNTVLGPLQIVRSINAGGGPTGGFGADASFSGGSASSSSATVTGVPSGVPGPLFRTDRNGNFGYTLNGLDPAAYHKLELYFAEVVSMGAGKRVFDVRVNGVLLLDNFDIVVAAGGLNKAVRRVFTLKPSPAGVISIQFTSVTGRAKVSGLALFKHLPAPVPALANAPGPVGDLDGDGVADEADAFPNDASESVDTDGDGMGDNADLFPVSSESRGAGRHTILIPAPEGVSGVGNGFGFLTLDAKLSGHLELTMGDGTRFSQSVKVSNRQLVIDATSAVAGGKVDTLKGTVAWVSNPGISEFNGSLKWSLGDLGAGIDLQAIGCRYTPGTLQGQIKKAEATVDLLGAPTDLELEAAIGGNSIVWGLSDAPGIFDATTGSLVWNVTDGNGRAITIRAVYFQEQNLLGGYFDDGLAERGMVRILPR